MEKGKSIGKTLRRGGEVMDEKKQIEEMAVLIFEASPIPSMWHVDAQKLSKALYNAGYRKIPDGAVVLTIEEVEEFRRDSAQVRFLKKRIQDDARKETAREILDMFDDRNIITWDDLKKQIAQRYGVEVDE